MNAGAVDSDCWSGRKWLFMAALILVGQLGLIFWLGRHKPQSATAQPTVTLRVERATNAEVALLNVDDAALFVLPNQYGFSGRAWLEVPQFDPGFNGWSEPARPLTLATDRIGNDLFAANQSNIQAAVQLTPRPEPTLETVAPVDDLWENESTLTLEGEINDRALLTPLKLKSEPWTDILTNTVVQAAVDNNGSVFSGAVLVRSGSREADTDALRLVRDARFSVVHPDPEQLNAARPHWVRFVFHWHTVPTNGAPATL